LGDVRMSVSLTRGMREHERPMCLTRDATIYWWQNSCMFDNNIHVYRMWEIVSLQSQNPPTHAGWPMGSLADTCKLQDPLKVFAVSQAVQDTQGLRQGPRMGNRRYRRSGLYGVRLAPRTLFTFCAGPYCATSTPVHARLRRDLTLRRGSIDRGA
jgi:hypothetical protein